MGLGTPSATAAPGVAAFVFPSLAGLYAGIERAYRLGVSLPNEPLEQFRKAVAKLPPATEVERLVVQRIGQDIFRTALMQYWHGRCPLTGISDAALLRASHIVAWSDCESDAQRLDVHNGLLLSSLWDAAFDVGLVSFTDEGEVLFSPHLSSNALGLLNTGRQHRLSGLNS